MWFKSSAAILGGCLVSISLMLNLNYLLPLSVDAGLMLGMLIGFPMWAAVMVWCYASKGGLQAWKRCAGMLTVSMALNTVLILSQT
ncbi:MAG: hypothetical protein COA96_02190 [SAR86 cluster bacterium]|uniref:Uncharacterized protein n=1 Tax=SAR86 cluster bacterium TaxID=2030880 RepID=A0A2A5B8V9_9GAMM|nr:MAG: hypothetical protein COA96_02190 [SAR86 cluster bacterium]